MTLSAVSETTPEARLLTAELHRTSRHEVTYGIDPIRVDYGPAVRTIEVDQVRVEVEWWAKRDDEPEGWHVEVSLAGWRLRQDGQRAQGRPRENVAPWYLTLSPEAASVLLAARDTAIASFGLAGEPLIYSRDEFIARHAPAA